MEPKDAELRDIHHRIDALRDESERQFRELEKGLHSLEVAVARGNRFPASAGVAAAALLVSVLGTGAILYTKLETANANASKALLLIEQHLSGASARAEAIEHATAVSTEWERRLPAIDERVKSLETRIVGQGPNGWHRADHEEYAKRRDAELETLRRRLDVLETRRK